MKKNIFYIIFLALLTSQNFSQSMFSELNSERINADEIIANIGQINITAEEFFYSYEFGPAFPKKTKNSKAVHLDYMIKEKLLTLEGLSSGNIIDLKIENIHNDITGDLATEELFKDEIVKSIEIDSVEINKAIKEESIEIELHWLFSESKNESYEYFRLLQSGIPFDTLFNAQLNDTIYLDQRSLKTSLFDLRKKNPVLYKIFNSLKLNSYSNPIQNEGGWYILSLINETKSAIQTKSEYDQYFTKSLNGLTKIKMDSLSDLYVHNVMLKHKPIIKREVFTILRTYIGKFVLDKNKFIDWELENKNDEAVNNIELKNNTNYSKLILVKTADSFYTLENFIEWYRNRELHLKFNRSNLVEFSRSLENMVWRMVRDNLLITEANEKNYFGNKWVKKQSSWWKDKIVYSAFKNELLKSIDLINNEITVEDKNGKSSTTDFDLKSTQKIFQMLQVAKKKYPVKINYNMLEKVIVSNQNDPHAIELYTAKNGGLIPRPAYPSIDSEWSTWQ